MMFNIELGLPSQNAWVRVPRWLELLEIEPHPKAACNAPHNSQTYILWGVALLRNLLIAGNIPYFDFANPSFEEIISETSTQLRVNLSMNTIDQIPISHYQTTIKGSFELLATLNRTEPTTENKSKIFARIFNHIILPLRKANPWGQSTIHVLRGAHARNIPFIHLGSGVFQLGWGSRSRYIDRSTTQADSALGAHLSHDKFVAAALLRRAGLPAPLHHRVSSEIAALKAAAHIGFPLVIKPSDQERGLGVSVNIIDESGVKNAFQTAFKFSNNKKVLIERQVSGTCHRIFISQGRLLYAVKRCPLRIWGDGIRTIAQIITDNHSAETARPLWQQSVAPTMDSIIEATLLTQGFSPHDIPPAHTPISLRPIETTAWGGFDEEVTLQIHPDNLAAALQAASLFKLSVTGIDIISPDISVPWHVNGAIINEVNFAPLLGGAKISRSYIPTYLAQLIDGDGRIPVEFYPHENEALARQQQLRHMGLRCYRITPHAIVNATDQIIQMPCTGQKQRINALLLKSDVDAIIVHQ